MIDRVVYPKNSQEEKAGSVLYYMQRDQRIIDNPALYFAQQKALEFRSPLFVVYPLPVEQNGINNYQLCFIMDGLEKLRIRLKEKGIPFFLLPESPETAVSKMVEKVKAAMIVTDFLPLRLKKIIEKNIERKSPCPLYVIDAHNVVPCTMASSKQEYAAYTIRKKIHEQLNEYLNKPEYTIQNHPYSSEISQNEREWEELITVYRKNKSSVSTFLSGEKAANDTLKVFISEKLPFYSLFRNNPVENAVSHLSPYLHTGQISARMIANAVLVSGNDKKNVDDFIEELIIRRELAENFCHYNINYDNVNGFPGWAKETHLSHRNDPREYIYGLNELEEAKTHDSLWNAAQMEIITTGKMHGYMRMYWAKKILEWTPAVEQALNIAIYLNDKYSLDGNDPNGYTGIMWSMGGVHDRPWFDRPIFGKIRYMNYNGCKSKFSITAYIKKVNGELV